MTDKKDTLDWLLMVGVPTIFIILIASMYYDHEQDKESGRTGERLEAVLGATFKINNHKYTAIRWDAWKCGVECISDTATTLYLAPCN